MAFVNEKENKRTIDYDKNAYLVHKATLRHDGSPVIGVFQLCWNGEEVVFHAIKTNEEDSGGLLISWDVTHIFGNPFLKNKKQDLLNLIEESLLAYGYLYQWTDISKINVKFSNKLIWQEIDKE